MQNVESCALNAGSSRRFAWNAAGSPSKTPGTGRSRRTGASRTCPWSATPASLKMACHPSPSPLRIEAIIWPAAPLGGASTKPAV